MPYEMALPCGVFEELLLFNSRLSVGKHFYDKAVVR